MTYFDSRQFQNRFRKTDRSLCSKKEWVRLDSFSNRWQLFDVFCRVCKHLLRGCEGYCMNSPNQQSSPRDLHAHKHTHTHTHTHLHTHTHTHTHTTGTVSHCQRNSEVPLIMTKKRSMSRYIFEYCHTSLSYITAWNKKQIYWWRNCFLLWPWQEIRPTQVILFVTSAQKMSGNSSLIVQI